MSSGKEMGRAAAVVGAVAARAAGELPDAAVVEELLALRRLADVAEAAFLDRLRVFDARGLGEADGLSTRAWLGDRLHVAPGEASRMLKLARGLDRLPETSAALAAGTIRVPHVAAMVDAVTLLGPEVVREAEAVFVEAARVEEPSRLRAALRGYGTAIDHPRAVKDAERRDEGRWLDVATTLDGVVSISGILGPEDGAIVKTAVETLTRPAGADDTRSATQRRADALVELCRRQLHGAALPSHGGEPPHLTVITDLTTLAGRASPDNTIAGSTRASGYGRQSGSRDDTDDDSGSGAALRSAPSTGFGELPDGTILPGPTVRRLACDAKITRVVLGPDSMRLDVGRSQRTVTSAQRKALRVRDGGCRFPGCGRPPDWCDAHHINFWSRGGRTDLDELVLLCRAHHTLIHREHWRIDLDTPGRFTFVTPDGQIRQPQPARTTTKIITRLMASHDDDDHDHDQENEPQPDEDAA